MLFDMTAKLTEMQEANTHPDKLTQELLDTLTTCASVLGGAVAQAEDPMGDLKINVTGDLKDAVAEYFTKGFDETRRRMKNG